ncbi:MAG: type II secretion system protein [Pseudomonadota bacterium]
MTLKRRGARGFSLIETLVALGIAGAVLSGFYSALSTGSLLAKRAGDQAQKVQLATQVLDRVGVDVTLRAGVQENGRDGGLAWALQIGQSPPPDMQLGPIYEGELLFVYVSVTELEAPEVDPVVIRAIRYSGGAL